MHIKRLNHLVTIFLELFVGERLQCKVSQLKSVQQHRQTLIFFLHETAGQCVVVVHMSCSTGLALSSCIHQKQKSSLSLLPSNNQTSHYFDNFICIYIVFNSLVSERKRERDTSAREVFGHSRSRSE
jgi:hypothetical protein